MKTPVIAANSAVCASSRILKYSFLGANRVFTTLTGVLIRIDYVLRIKNHYKMGFDYKMKAG